jgi:hypothetical protein
MAAGMVIETMANGGGRRLVTVVIDGKTDTIGETEGDIRVGSESFTKIERKSLRSSATIPSRFSILSIRCQPKHSYAKLLDNNI